MYKKPQNSHLNINLAAYIQEKPTPVGFNEDLFCLM